MGSDAFMIMGYHSVLGCYEKRKRKIKKSKRPKTKTHSIIMVSHEQNSVVTYVLSPLLYCCTIKHLGDPYLTKLPQLHRHHFSIYCIMLFQGKYSFVSLVLVLVKFFFKIRVWFDARSLLLGYYYFTSCVLRRFSLTRPGTCADQEGGSVSGTTRMRHIGMKWTFELHGSGQGNGEERPMQWRWRSFPYFFTNIFH